ncbi:MAG: hypothetical protein BGO05_29845 [Rhizobiales bacterium 63-7]|nr:DUF2061 domain-containing protein [Hyphomicrobiales bacterium]OJU70889.1 MAG: hypothetical protein BGO05_29845 [Rhizobiales bacterium 63-7]
MDTHKRSIVKALSWRATGSVDTILISLVITGSIRLAATIGFTEVVTKSLLYYFHERVWLRVPFGRANPSDGIS